MKREMIVAYGQAREIGRNGDMPWGRNLPADLRHFRDLTVGKSAIMGYNTYKSIGRPLTDRENIVVTSRRHIPCGVTVARSLDEAYELASAQPIVIGGAQLYKAALPHTDIIYATEVQAEFPGSDTFFPELPRGEYAGWNEGDFPADDRNKYAWRYVTYERGKGRLIQVIPPKEI
ncbi:MAG: dihydrofolate reductase [Candidatus Saccharimonas sp.]